MSEEEFTYPEFDPDKQYCGPECNPFLAALVPDKLGKINFSRCCYEHDKAYRRGGFESDRKRADKVFFRCLCNCIWDAVGFRRFLYLWPIAWVYYRAVRRGGSDHFNYALVRDQKADDQIE